MSLTPGINVNIPTTLPQIGSDTGHTAVQNRSTEQLEDITYVLHLSGPPKSFSASRSGNIDSQAIPQRPLEQRKAETGTGALDRFKQWFTGLFAKKETPSAPQTPVTIDAGRAGTFSLSPSILPKLPSGVNMDQGALLTAIGEKIEKGHALLQTLGGLGPNDAIPGPASQEDVSNIMWYLQAKAETKVGPHSRGAITVPDPNQNIRKFLDSSADVYQRSSTHIHEFQKNGSTHRGIDLGRAPNFLADCLPNGQKTMLFGSMPKSETMPGDRLYLKMETHGARISTLSKDQPDGPASRALRKADIGESVGHLFSLIKSKLPGGHGSAPSFRERIPTEIKSEYKATIKAFKDAGHSDVAELLSRNKASSNGIRHMIANMNDAYGLFNRSEPPISDDLKNRLASLHDSIRANPRLDNPSVRIGGEVILTSDLVFN